MSRLLQALRSGRVLLMDGAMGTELLRAGLRPGECGELWNITHPAAVSQIHQAYREAGAEVLLTNTFQANPVALARHGLSERLAEINGAGLALARSAAGAAGFVLADAGPILSPATMEEFPDLELLPPLLATLAGADGVLLETCSSPRALTAVEFSLHRVPELAATPLLLSLTYRRDAAGHLTTFSGDAPELFASRAARHGVAALGVNCGRDIGMQEVVEILRHYRQETDLPLFARPNAGVAPNLRTPGEMVDHLPALLEVGIAMIGGCCGTTAEHIAAFGRGLNHPGPNRAQSRPIGRGQREK